RLAPQVGRSIEAAIGAGRLSIAAGRIISLETSPDQVRVIIRRRGRAEGESHAFDRAIDCSGPRNEADARSALQSGLAAAGLLRSDPLHLGLDVDGRDGLVAASGAAGGRL